MLHEHRSSNIHGLYGKMRLCRCCRRGDACRSGEYCRVWWHYLRQASNLSCGFASFVFTFERLKLCFNKGEPSNNSRKSSWQTESGAGCLFTPFVNRSHYYSKWYSELLLWSCCFLVPLFNVYWENNAENSCWQVPCVCVTFTYICHLNQWNSVCGLIFF